MSHEAPLKILVIDENPIRRAILDAGLKDAGFQNITLLGDTNGLIDRIYAVDPDVIIIDLQNPSRDVLEQMFQVSRIVRRPIAMFVDQSDRATIEKAIDAGVSAYIVDGLKRERVRAILDMTISRFSAFERLRAELEQTKSALKERKVIEKAKGILMKSRGLDEAAAYALLRRTAMSKGKRISDIAESLVSAIDLLET
jgi:two-component system, response regulator / RNA-binding antiterminator